MTRYIWYASRPLFIHGPGEPAQLPGNLTDENVPGNLPAGCVAVQLDNGRYLSVQPQGNYEDRDAVGGYETFTLDTQANLLRVKPRDVTYVIPIGER